MTADPRPARLTLGPLLFNWPAEAWRDFYFRIADEAPFDTVHLGEVVCSKRRPVSEQYLDQAAQRLAAAGKEVVLSSLALVMSEAECESTRALAGDSHGHLVEANDISAVAALAGRPHVIGPFVNAANEDSLACLVRMGACRVSLSAELPAASIALLAALRLVELEVAVFGRLPLALSARCYHARAHGRHKDSCGLVCGGDPAGLEVETIDEVPFLTVNGTQTMSHRLLNQLGGLGELRSLGVDRFRLWPHPCDMVAVASLFRETAEGRMAPAEANDRLAALLPEAEFANGYLHGREGLAWVE